MHTRALINQSTNQLTHQPENPLIHQLKNRPTISRLITYLFFIKLLFFAGLLFLLFNPAQGTTASPQLIPTNPADQRTFTTHVEQKKVAKKIVGLLQVRNEAAIIEQCLQALARYTDAIVVLDDASQDNTITLIKALAQELHIETIIENKRSAWQHSTENENRQKLLDVGRAIKGTHFILIDADEMFSANCEHGNWLRSIILSLEPGMVFHLPCVNLWDGVDQYRDDEWCSPSQKRWVKPIAFCDDGICSYANNQAYGGPAKILHAARIPVNIAYQQSSKLRRVRTLNDNYVLLHFKYANLDNIIIKKNWYMCLEFIRSQQKRYNRDACARDIKMRYNTKEFECLVPSKELTIVKPVNPAWLAYPFINKQGLLAPHQQMLKELTGWFAAYGSHYFDALELAALPN